MTKLRAVILDWAGTTVDFGCHAPVAVLTEVFKGNGVEIMTSEARMDMGLPKRAHIEKILQMPRVAAAWQTAHGHLPGEDVVDHLYRLFVPLQMRTIVELSDVIEGVPDLVTRLRARNLKIGSSTGYTRAMLDLLLPRAAAQGYAPDTCVTPEESWGGRPEPWMCFTNMARLGVYPPKACVKVGDTIADIEEGLNAGMLTVGVIDSSNEVGLRVGEWRSLNAADQHDIRDRVRRRFEAAGAHYTISLPGDLDHVLDSIESRL